MALDFDGTDDRASWASIFTTSGQALTISLWMNADDVTPATAAYFFNGSAAAGGAGTVFFQRAASQSIGFTRVTNSTLKDRFSNVDVFTAGTWVNVILTDDGTLTAANAHLYVNGAEVGYSTTTNGAGTETAATGVWALGGRTSDNLRNWDGRMAEVGVWNRVLDAGEIAILADAYSPVFISNGLRFWAPLSGRGTAVNRLGALASATVGTAYADHPRIIYPSPGGFSFVAGAAAATPNVVRRPRIFLPEPVFEYSW